MTTEIKKYKNRRLYDTEKSRYITAQEILEEYILKGAPFKVIDAATGTDITTQILLQIFVEMETGPRQFLSSDMLKQLIILANHPFSKIISAQFQQFFQHTHQFLHQGIGDAKDIPPWKEEINEFSRQWEKYFKL